KLDVLRRHCDAVGRDYDTIVKSMDVNLSPLRPGEDPETATEALRPPLGMTLDNLRNISVVGTPDEITEYLQQLADAGIQYFIITLPRLAYDEEPLSRFAETVISRF